MPAFGQSTYFRGKRFYQELSLFCGHLLYFGNYFLCAHDVCLLEVYFLTSTARDFNPFAVSKTRKPACIWPPTSPRLSEPTSIHARSNRAMKGR